MGPLAKMEFVEDLERQLETPEKRRHGLSWAEAADPGFFFQPAVLTDLTADMLVVREELFGPIAPVITGRTEEEMIRIANATEFGLGATSGPRSR